MQRLVIKCPRANISAHTIYNMRHSGATLQQIADKIGKTKETVRQILVRNYGSTKHKLISTEQLCKLLDLPRNRVIGLYRDSVITPVREWDTNIGHYLLWSPAAVERVNIYYKTRRLCKMCHSCIPKSRRCHCSEQCYNESRKYKYKSIEAKQRHLGNIKRYREKCKQIAQAAVIGNSKRQPLSLGTADSSNL